MRPDPSSRAGGESYDPEYFAPLFAAEDRHFWFRGRNPLIAGMVRGLAEEQGPGYRVLEAGCGTGSVLRVLEQVCNCGTVFGMDLFREGLQYAQRRVDSPLVQGDIHHQPFAAGFEVIGLFDVLEHLADDIAVLRDLRAMLVPGGALVLTVPARKSLWSYFDEASHHVRRYEKEELCSHLEQSGLTVEYLSPYMMSIFPLVWLNRRLARSGDGAAKTEQELAESELQIIPVVNEVLAWVLQREAGWVARRRQLPFGTSLIAVARRAI